MCQEILYFFLAISEQRLALRARYANSYQILKNKCSAAWDLYKAIHLIFRWNKCQIIL